MQIDSSTVAMASNDKVEVGVVAPAIIDVHTHLVPRDFPANPAPSTNTRWPCMCHHDATRATIAMGEKPFRELDPRSWDLSARRDSMAQEGIAVQVLSPMPELLSYWFEAPETLALGRHVNGAISELIAAGSGSFRGFGMVPLQSPDLAASELSRLRADGFCGVEIGSNINGVLPGDARFDEFYAEAERLQLALFVHALHPVGVERLASTPDLIPFAAFPLDVALAIASLLRSGVPERFPDLKFGFSHGGGAVIPVVHRLQKAWEISEQFKRVLPSPPAAYTARFFYDSLVYDAGYLRYLMREFAPGQVFAGTDYPFPIEQTGLRKFLDSVADGASDAIYNATASRFIGD